MKISIGKFQGNMGKRRVLLWYFKEILEIILKFLRNFKENSMKLTENLMKCMEKLMKLKCKFDEINGKENLTFYEKFSEIFFVIL